MWHVHLVAEQERRGVYIYDQCRCGARRTRRMGRMYSALLPDWPAAGSGWSPR